MKILNIKKILSIIVMLVILISINNQISFAAKNTFTGKDQSEVIDNINAKLEEMGYTEEKIINRHTEIKLDKGRLHWMRTVTWESEDEEKENVAVIDVWGNEPAYGTLETYVDGYGETNPWQREEEDVYKKDEETGTYNPVTSDEDKKELKDPIEDPDFYKPTDTTGKNTKFINIGNIIIGIIRTVATVIAVIALMIMGLRYMFGSVEQKANFKETMIPYIIGAVMVFTIPNVLGIIYDLVKGINF